MKPELLRASARFLRGALARFATWRKPLARVGLLLGGLVALALIGRAAAAPAATLALPPATTASSAFDRVPDASSVPAPPPPPAAASSRSQARATPDNPVILNDATLEDLRRLPGIGPKRAAAVFALRSKLGRFHRVEDLLRVKGIGRTTLKRLRPLVRVDRVDTPPPLAAAPSAAQ